MLTPSAQSSELAVGLASQLVAACGADLVLMSAERHDQAVALVSHVPQIMSSAVAARLVDAQDDLIALCGQGIRDVTRVAASDPQLWTQIVEGNAAAIVDVLDAVVDDLTEFRDSLLGIATRTFGSDEPASRLIDMSTSPSPDSSLNDLLMRGAAGRRRIPGKHGTAPAVYLPVPVVVPDRPGELARLLVAAGDAGINVEDVAIEHSPGQPVGLVTLSVGTQSADQLADALRANGWTVHR